MDWAKIAEIALACIVSVGGIGTIIVAIVKWCSDIIADRLSKKYQLQLDKEMEKYKTELSKKEYVSKTRFDAEFSIYRELTSAFSKMVTDISIMIPTGYVEVPADKETRDELDKQHYITANQSVVTAQNVLYANETFINEDFCYSYQELLKLARVQLLAYTRRFNVYNLDPNKKDFSMDDYKRTDELNQKWREHTDKIRNYLASLDVIS